MRLTSKTLFIGAGILVSLVLINFIFYPSYISTKVACFPDEVEYIKAGETSLNQTSGDITITYFEGDVNTLKHEVIHYNQFTRNPVRTSTCGLFGSTRYLVELEAYAGSYLPDFIYKPIYGDYELLIEKSI